MTSPEQQANFNVWEAIECFSFIYRLVPKHYAQPTERREVNEHRLLKLQDSLVRKIGRLFVTMNERDIKALVWDQGFGRSMSVIWAEYVDVFLAKETCRALLRLQRNRQKGPDKKYKDVPDHVALATTPQDQPIRLTVPSLRRRSSLPLLRRSRPFQLDTCFACNSEFCTCHLPKTRHESSAASASSHRGRRQRRSSSSSSTDISTSAPPLTTSTPLTEPTTQEP